MVQYRIWCNDFFYRSLFLCKYIIHDGGFCSILFEIYLKDIADCISISDMFLECKWLCISDYFLNHIWEIKTEHNLHLNIKNKLKYSYIGNYFSSATHRQIINFFSRTHPINKFRDFILQPINEFCCLFLKHTEDVHDFFPCI